jgi:proline iminopeptidase
LYPVPAHFPHIATQTSSGFALSELGIPLDMHNQPSRKSIGKDHVTWLYPLVEPYKTGRLKRSPLHEVEESGNPFGKPVVFLHGGPGGGSEPKQRRFFHPDRYRVVNFEQRGSGKSTPYVSLKENTTWDLVGDMEKLRGHLGVARWMVFEGSWGSTLALAYSQTHPDRDLASCVHSLALVRALSPLRCRHFS